MAASTALQVLVSPFLGVVFENLGSLIQKEIGVVLGVNKELKKLSNTLSTIRDVMEDAEVKQIDDKPIYNWLRRLKDLAYEADDILDECATEALIPKVTSPSDSSCFDFKGIMFRHSIGKRIKELRKKFDEMADERIKFHLNLIPGNVESRKEKRETSSFLTEPQVYGRAEEKEHIANLLLKGGAGEDVSVCCIVGMGGLGKTTLAQMVYNDEEIIKHFQLRCWVCVSDPFVLKTLLKSIIESTGGNARDLEDLDPLQRRVQGILSGKKFLLVLDDVWNEDQTKWYKLKSVLTCGGIGSSIIVTTRLQSVASMTTAMLTLCLKVLSDENGWSLFKHYAFEENERYHPMLEEIGKEIVKKCGGVPLAAKALGGLLRYKREESEWLFVRDSALWDLPQDKEDAILPALRLSYNHLPLHLKQCFSYCSIFPKDYEMGKDDLIHLWMANGFLPSKDSMELEDIGNEIFNELLWRSFFQDATKDEYGDIMDCKMHDLVHDLACSVTVSECTVVKVEKGQNAFKGITRHLSLEVGYYVSTTNSIFDLIPSQSQPLLRTLLLIAPVYTMDGIQQIITYSNLECLRVLDLRSIEMHELHVSIRNLKHLRYLNLSNCRKMRSLPGESICSLRNLQVLKLDRCYNLQVLPENMRKLTNLRHLGITGCYKLRRMPVGMGNLSCLRTLSQFVVAPESGRGISELHELDHLTGGLRIKGLEHVRNSKDAKSANLIGKKNISELSLSWSQQNNSSITITIEEDKEIASIGESLQPHSNIRKLYIFNYNGLKFPSWMSHSCLPNLVVVWIVNWRRCENLPSLGNLPLLESLRISGMDSLKCIGDEFYGDHASSFPALKKLEIYGMPNLEDWSSSSKGGELEVFPSLEILKLKRCPKLRNLPRLPSFLKEFSLGCPKLGTLPRLPSSLKELHLIECSEMILERILENVSSNSSSSLSTFKIRFDREFICTRRWAPMLRKLACLQRLKISCCHKMKILPKELLENLPTTLTDLTIGDGVKVYDYQLPEEKQNLTSRIFCTINDCMDLVCLPEEIQKLTSLQNFNLIGCSSLKSLPELGSRNNNTVMTKLEIQSCFGLTSVSDCLRHLTTLEELLINDSPELEFLQDDFQDLKSLRHLTILSLPQMTCLPEGLQQVAGTLERLFIVRCSGMTSLPEWMDKFTSLEKLFIRGCENLKVLPEQVLQLTALKDVSIYYCHPDLHRRYTKETGEDWHKIAHIPNLDISEYRHGGEKTRMRCINNNIMSCFSSSSSSSSSSGTN